MISWRTMIPQFLLCLVLLTTLTAHSKKGAKTSINTKNQVEALVQELGHDQFKVREQAHRKLVGMGKEILPILEKTSAPDDPESRQRIQSVIGEICIRPLLGTKWHIEHTSEVDVQDLTIEFLKDGKFRAVSGSQHTPDNETWDEPEPHPKGDIIRFHFNDKYSTYKGHRIDSRTIIGSSKNIKGVTWTWRATLVE